MAGDHFPGLAGAEGDALAALRSETAGTREQGNEGTGFFRVWLRAVRPFSFSASATPVVVGTAAAFFDGRFHAGLLLITLVASVAIHAAANLSNDYYDHAHGVDTTDSIGPSGVIQQGLLAPRTVLAGALVLFAVAGTLGIWLIAARGWPIVLIGVLSVLAGYAYTGGPLPLGYVGLGDLVVFVFMGLVITCGAYYVQAGTVSATAVWAALPLAALVTAVLVVNNLRDVDEDRAKGKRTLATFLGRRGTRGEYMVLIVASYAVVLVGIVVGVLPVAAALVLMTLPEAARLWQIVRGEADTLVLTRALRGTAALHMKVGLLLALSFAIATVKIPL